MFSVRCMSCSAVLFICLFNNLLQTNVELHLRNPAEKCDVRLVALGLGQHPLYNQSRLFKRTEPLIRNAKNLQLDINPSNYLLFYIPPHLKIRRICQHYDSPHHMGGNLVKRYL